MNELTCNLDQLKNFARELAAKTKAPACICLIGDLGAGKTEFARSFINYFSKTNVSSPTFNILQTYGNIYHFDLYRIKSAEELHEIGLEEALNNNICLIEWPQIAESFLPKDRTTIKFEILDNDTRRIIIS